MFYMIDSFPGWSSTIVAPLSPYKLMAIASEAVCVWAVSWVSKFSTLISFSFLLASLNTSTFIEFSKDAGSLKLTAKPPWPIKFSALFLASASWVLSFWNSAVGEVCAPSSATLLAAPGASISRSISWFWSCLAFCLRMPSFLTSSSCLSFSSLFLNWLF